MSLLLSVLLWVCSTCNNANGNKLTSDIFSGIAWYYGDNDFIIWTFDFIARLDVVCNLQYLIQIFWRDYSSTGTDSRVTCSKKYGFL